MTFDELNWVTKKNLLASFWRTKAAEGSSLKHEQAAELARRLETANETELEFLISEFKRQQPKMFEWVRKHAPEVLEIGRRRAHA